MGGRVITRIYGGMGNQMFQYAAGRALALRSESTLQLDCRQLQSRDARSFGLGHFNVERAIVQGKLPPQRKGQRIRHFFWRRFQLSPRLVEEKAPGFDTRFLEPMTNVFLDGYWQSERYFSDAVDSIRADFQFLAPPDDENARYLDVIKSSPAVSLHVRRGDYTRPEVLAQFGLPTPAYYLKAVHFVASRMADVPIIYVFSDEPDWPRTNLALPFETRVVGHNGPNRNHEDMRLMSACRHHIIANSSFSWWGAWLNPSPDKIVVAPKQWFLDPSLNNPDITPQSWYRLDN